MNSLWYKATNEEIALETKRRSRIPDEEFQTVLDWAVIPTADFVVTRITGGARQFLLVMRNEEPWKGEFFVPGGRILPGMTVEQGLLANCNRELGFVPIDYRYLGDTAVFNPSRSNGVPCPWYSLWHLYEVQVESDTPICLNQREGKEFRWFDTIDPNFPEPVKRALEKLGF